MYNYDPKSSKAEEFINDGEILETLRYADENKNNRELVEAIIEKARPVKNKSGSGYTCAGLTHREASVPSLITLTVCQTSRVVRPPL